MLRLKVAYKGAVAMAVGWLATQAWGVDWIELSYWRGMSGIVLMLVCYAYLDDAVTTAEDD